MTKNQLSALSNRDLNREYDQKENDTIDSQYRGDKSPFIADTQVRERFNRDFLPKYGELWRKIICNKEGVTGSATSSLVTPVLPNPRAINFVDAIERRQAVSISASGQHEEECECGCEPPIVEVIDLVEETHIRNSIGIVTLDSRKSETSSQEDNNTPQTTYTDYEQTGLEGDKGDTSSVYETADEYDNDSTEAQNYIAPVDAKAHSINEGGCGLGWKEQEQEQERTENIIIIDSDSDESDINKNAAQVHKSGEEIVKDDSDGDEEGSLSLCLPTVHITTRKKSTIGTEKRVCPSPKSILGAKLATDVNLTLEARDDNPLVDTDDEADDEADDDHESESDHDEEEWIPDDEMLQPSIKSTQNSKHYEESSESEKKMISETIDLCDSSSNGLAADSDFTLSDDGDGDSCDDNNFQEKEIVSKIVSKIQVKRKKKPSFRRNRDQITSLAFNEFNQKAFKGELGNVVVQWSKKLNTTAGLTRLQKISRDMTPGVPLKRQAVIELSTKVVDDEEKLRTTLLHELVHAAVWIFEGVSKPPHGAAFKRWAKMAMSKVPDVTVTTTHSYHIQYRFNWACVNPRCSFTIGRHSKSVDTARHRCGLCKSKLIEVTPDGAPKKTVKPSAYNLFVKQHSKAIRQQLVKRDPNVTQADVMKELGRLWRQLKVQNRGELIQK